MYILDNISGELIECLDMNVAIDIAKWRVEQHNSEYNYSHRGKHYNANCEYKIIDKEHIIIDRVGKN